MFSFLLDLFAPKASAELTTLVQIPFSSIVDDLNREHRITFRTDDTARFKIKGNFFAAIESVGVAKGAQPNPSHYKNIAFNLNVEDLGHGNVRLTADQRVIFGWLETRAVSNALSLRLTLLKNRIAR